MIPDATGDICWGCMYREVASHFEGDVGTKLFDYYDAINEVFFGKRLPWAFLLTALTNYGSCIGMTKPDRSRKPIILIHPTLKDDRDIFYTVLHEAIPVQVIYNLGYTGDQSHDCDEWLSEVNRIAKMLGYTGAELGRSKVKRIPKDGIPKKGGGRLRRESTGNLPYDCTFRFPHPLEQVCSLTSRETGYPLPPIERWLSDVTLHGM